MSTQKMAIGFGATLVTGLVLGLALGPLTSSLAARTMDDVASPSGFTDPSMVTVEEVSGEVWARWSGPGWRPITAGETLRRPVTFRCVGIDGYVRVSVKGARLVMSQEAVAHLGAAGLGLTFQVDQGLVLAYRDKQSVQAIAPLHEVEVTGPGFGIWVRPNQVNVSVLERDAEIRYRQDEPEKVPFGREVTLRKGDLTKAMLPTKLEAEVISKRRSGSRSRIAARTWDHARVFSFGRRGFEEVRLRSSGTFTIRVPGDMPAPGTLLAFDSAGRWAELGQPSRRLEQVIHDLKTGQPRRARVVPEDDAPVVKSRPSPPPPPPRESRPEASRARARSDEGDDDEVSTAPASRDDEERKERRERRVKTDREGSPSDRDSAADRGRSRRAPREEPPAPPPQDIPDAPPVEEEEEDLERAL